MNENILQSFKSESAQCIKLLSLKRKSRLWIIEMSPFLKRIQSRFMMTSTWNFSILPTHLWSFCVGLNENAKSFFATRCCFWSSKHSGFPGNTVHKAALHSQTLLYQALQAWWNENYTNRTNHCRLTSRKGGVWKKWIV